MEKVFKWILKHQKFVLILFAISTIVCIVLKTQVSVNYDLLDYLPDEANSTKALDIMQSEFSGGIPNVRVMVEDVSLVEAQEMKEQLLSIKGVDDVMWLDDTVDLKQPLGVLDKESVETYYKDGHAVYMITISEDNKIETIAQIDDLIGETGAMSGAAVSTAAATVMSGIETTKIIRIVIPICMIILLITTTSYFEPILFMLTIGIAIALNAGTNLIFGEVSFVTNAAANVLQLAVSMDYSIFLLHRFAEYREHGYDVKDAMILALKKSVSSIASSGLTTVIGFAALVLMRFKIGPDMGYVLAKGVLFSLISVLVLLPILTIKSYKLIDKTHHKPFVPKFNKFSQFVFKLKPLVLIAFFIVLVPSYLAQTHNDFYYGSTEIFDSETTDVGRDSKKIDEVFGPSNNFVLLLPNHDVVTEKLLSDELKQIPEVNSIISYVDLVGNVVPTEFLDEQTKSKLISNNYSRMILNVKTDYESDASFDVVNQIKQLSAKYYGKDYLLAGDTVSTFELKEIVIEDNLKVNVVAIAAVLVVLIITFKSITLPIILILVIETSIWLNLSVPYFQSHYIFYIAYLIIGSIQLGATVDYAILFANRYLENRETKLKKLAIKDTINDTAVSILTSASILTLSGFALGVISSNGVTSQLGTLIGRGAILSTLLVLFVLPGLLYIFDGLIQKTSLNLTFKKQGEVQ